MSNKNILVIGATGGIGRSTVKSLVELGHNVRVLVRSKEKAEKYFTGFNNVEIFEGDASNYGSVYNASAGMGAMFYCLNIPYMEWYDKAVAYLTTALDAAAEQKLRFVFPGNVYLYGHAKYNPVDEKHPHDPHTRKGMIRKQMEALIKKYSEEKGLRYTIARFPDFYGPFVVNGFSEMIYVHSLKGKKMIWVGNKTVPQEFIFIEDAGKCIVEAGLSEKGMNQEFNIPSCGVISSKDYLSIISKLGGKKAKFQLVNSNFVFAALSKISPIISELTEMLYLKREEFYLDGTKFKNTFGYLPSTNYETGIQKTFDWVRTFYKI